MKNLGEDTFIYHITDIENLSRILMTGGLISDAQMTTSANDHTVIGYQHIKRRRLEEIQVSSSGRYVGEYVPFYFCPRSPMLLTINSGNTGRTEGCQKTILHLVSRVKHGISTGRDWAISDMNAGMPLVTCYRDISFLGKLNWDVIGATYWSGMQHEKMAEFLLADKFPWEEIIEIGCYDNEVREQVLGLIASEEHNPIVNIKRDWYY